MCKFLTVNSPRLLKPPNSKRNTKVMTSVSSKVAMALLRSIQEEQGWPITRAIVRWELWTSSANVLIHLRMLNSIWLPCCSFLMSKTDIIFVQCCSTLLSLWSQQNLLVFCYKCSALLLLLYWTLTAQCGPRGPMESHSPLSRPGVQEGAFRPFCSTEGTSDHQYCKGIK